MQTTLKSRRSLTNEIEQLLKVYESFSIQEHPHPNRLSRWLDDMHLMRAEGRWSLKAEREIEERSMELRRIWIEYAQSYSNFHLKSPPLNTMKILPSNNKIDFSYERNIQANLLEERSGQYRSQHDLWNSDHVMFSSGMASISTFMQSYLGMFKPSIDKPLTILSWSDYFETRVMMDLYSRDSVHYYPCKSQEELESYITIGDIFFIEPVRYNWDLEVLNLETFLSQLKALHPDKISVLVMDTTLIGDTLDMSGILEFCSQVPNLIIVQIHSCLKLDQQGFEYSNAGLLSIYTTKRGNLPEAKEFGQYIRKVRTILGTGLGLEEIALLDQPYFLNKHHLNSYCSGVFKHNRELAHSIESNGIFKKVAHPSINSTFPWAVSPFVVFHLKEDTLENHGFLLGVVLHEAESKGLTFSIGSSFGFRSHRFEVIIPNVSEGKGLFKVAMGFRDGPSKDAITKLFKKLSLYKSFHSLRKDYPTIKPVNLVDIKE